MTICTPVYYYLGNIQTCLSICRQAGKKALMKRERTEECALRRPVHCAVYQSERCSNEI